MIRNQFTKMNDLNKEYSGIQLLCSPEFKFQILPSSTKGLSSLLALKKKKRGKIPNIIVHCANHVENG